MHLHSMGLLAEVSVYRSAVDRKRVVDRFGGILVNVAFVSNVVYSFVTGGAQKRVHEIDTRLVEQGHKVTVYGRHFWDRPKQTTHEGLGLRAVRPPRTSTLTTGARSRKPSISALDWYVLFTDGFGRASTIWL